MRQHTYYEAYLDDYDRITVFFSRESYGGVSNYFHLKDSFGHIQELTIQSVEQTQNNYIKYTLSIPNPIIIGMEYYVVHQFAREAILEYAAITKTTRFDEEFYYDGNDLGFSYGESQTSFALWAPTAARVKLEIEKNGSIQDYEMKRCDCGVFRYALLDNLENAKYQYLVRVNGEWKETIDPYGIASDANAKRSVVVDLRKIKQKEYDLPTMNSNCDAIIYEASVRDFTIQKGIGVEHPGSYLGFCEESETTKQKKTGFSYLKSLGITHVQLMPVLDFGSVDENYPFMFYNWGYDPTQWRCLEGSFSDNADSAYARMFEFSKLVEECHKNGIRVNLDVVFNHVYDMNTNALQMTVPNYFFQMDCNGNFSNGSFCGNDVDTTRKMCRKLIVDTCRFLCKTYHIDGFRFDLMGILDIATMNEIRSACREYNSDFMVYGEGWNMPCFLNEGLRASIGNQSQMPQIAHFSDRFRDIVKGNTSDYEINAKGFCSGAVYLIDYMKDVMAASCINNNGYPMFQNPTHAINYVECHDNMTCWDKLRECCKEDTRDIRIQRHKMCIAAVLLAQGIPFIHSGQEFARTKHGKGNTYNDSDEINKIDYERKDRYQEIVEATKALIQIRKEHSVLRYATADEVRAHVFFRDIDRKVLIYEIHDESESMIIFFNPTHEQFHYHFEQPYELLYYNAQCTCETICDLTIEAISTIILACKHG